MEMLREVVVEEDFLQVWRHPYQISDDVGIIRPGCADNLVLSMPAGHPDAVQAGGRHKLKFVGIWRWREQASESEGVQEQFAPRLQVVAMQGLQEARGKLAAARKM